MLSRTIILVTAGLFLTFANGCLGKSSASSLDRVAECLDSSSRGAAEMASTLEEGVEDKPIIISCDYTKIISDCLAETFEPSDDLLDFIRAYVWQRSLLEQKTNICPERNLDNLKDLVIKSGIMKKENLTSIETVAPGSCAEQTHRQCLLETEDDWEKNLSQLSLFSVLITCENIGADSCSDPDPMMEHFSKINKAFVDHVSEHHGALAKKMVEIKN